MTADRRRNRHELYNRDGTLKRRFEILQWIFRYAEAHNGNSPSTVEVGRAFGLNQKTAWRHMITLEEEGYLNFRDNKWIVANARWIQPDLHN